MDNVCSIQIKRKIYYKWKINKFRRRKYWKLIDLLNDFNLEGEDEEYNKNDYSSKLEENNKNDNIEDDDNALANQDINKTNTQLNINEDGFSFNEIDSEKFNVNDKEGS